MLRKQGLARGAGDSAGWGEKRLEDEFEPFIISEKYMTPKDDIIRETDIPERIQVTIDGLLSSAEFDLAKQAPNLLVDFRIELNVWGIFSPSGI